jgi:hypothetical protein
MGWNALIGALIGAGIPGILTYIGLRRGRQSSDAEAFGAAILLLDRVNPERVTINLNPDPTAEDAKWAELQEQFTAARERLLVVSAGHPQQRVRELALDTEIKIANAFHASQWAVRDMQNKRDNPEWMTHARKAHGDAEAKLRELIDTNFAWSIFGHRLYGIRLKRKAAKPAIEGSTTEPQISARA